MGTREGVAAKIDAETKVKIEEMNKMVKAQQELVSNTCSSHKKNQLHTFSHIAGYIRLVFKY